MPLCIVDLDDTLAWTTRDLRGSWDRIPLLTLVPGARAFLTCRKYELVLVSAGRNDVQRRKIAVLGIGAYFRKIIIVASPAEKSEAIRRVAKDLRYAPREIAVIGDRVEYEIRAGNRLGCYTIRVRLGGSSLPRREPQPSDERPDHTVRDFREVGQLLSKIFTT